MFNVILFYKNHLFINYIVNYYYYIITTVIINYISIVLLPGLCSHEYYHEH